MVFRICKQCGETKSHYAKGLCGDCYNHKVVPVVPELDSLTKVQREIVTTHTGQRAFKYARKCDSCHEWFGTDYPKNGVCHRHSLRYLKIMSLKNGGKEL